MEMLIEIAVEFFGGLFLELYISIASMIVPDKQFKKWQTVLLRALSMLVMLASLGALIAGIVILASGGNFVLGVALTAAGGVIVAVHIIFAVIVIARGGFEWPEED